VRLQAAFSASRSPIGAASSVVKCMQATGASKVHLWKAIMVKLQPILLQSINWKVVVEVGDSHSVYYAMQSGSLFDQLFLWFLHSSPCLPDCWPLRP